MLFSLSPDSKLHTRVDEKRDRERHGVVWGETIFCNFPKTLKELCQGGTPAGVGLLRDKLREEEGEGPTTFDGARLTARNQLAEPRSLNLKPSTLNPQPQNPEP